MTLTVTILGCGSSAGVPRVGGGWGACNPANPKNRRRRCSIHVSRRGGSGRETGLLVDTGPDLREQLLDADIEHLDAVLYTHEHADHTHGIDDLRGLVLHMRRRLDVYADDHTLELLSHRFGYCFETPPGSSYPPILAAHRLEAGEKVEFSGDGGVVDVLPVRLNHGDIDSLAFRFEADGKAMAYAPDVKSIPAASLDQLRGLDLLIVDSLRHMPHQSHFSVDDALALIDNLRPRRALLTDLHADLDYDALSAALPEGVAAAYDGLRVTL
ncbi:MBL fold metallo-hydrolase [Pseudochelatococcus contaminans]|uniref:Phosphoribosyl 1,2-cyclic phosphate phosphodiesterase n=1 Tax=Pseudochelatococcus contaminans TaxID=1538103 RepID=A0A7W5Z1L3_9HYPH|nr:MBL fold metallo-hydrolase [Pseudochelatococcus contaminans]MBB3808096.1 phosphoribosyl 1,2-cyclic phosphate phosphodiesterase [Pseudochelatococcus contaminans]